MQPTCIYCGKNSDLNTQLTISLEDGTKVTVDICDEHAEDATVKTARAKYVEKQDQIAQFLEQAKALGIEIQAPSPGGSGIVLAQQAPPPPTQQAIQAPAPVQAQPEPVSPLVEAEEEKEGWVSTAKVDAADRKGMRSVGGSTEFGAVSGHASYNIQGQKDVLPEQARRGKVKMSIAEGRAGTPIAVPERRVDGTGTTRIRIVNKESDHSLQRRFKDMAQDSRNDRQPDFRNGYDESTRTCPICHGDCVVGDEDCPKCDGLGVISVY